MYESQVRQNIIDYINSLPQQGQSFDNYVYNMQGHPNYPNYPILNKANLMTPVQYQEYENIRLHVALNTLQKLPKDIRDYIIECVIKAEVTNLNDLANEILGYIENLTFEYQQLVGNPFNMIVYQFLWNNYNMLPHLKRVDPIYYQ